MMCLLPQCKKGDIPRTAALGEPVSTSGVVQKRLKVADALHSP